MSLPLCSYYQPATNRSPALRYNSAQGKLKDLNNLHVTMNYHATPQGSTPMPRTPDSYDTYLYTNGCKIPYKICPDTDCEEVTNIGDPAISIVEKAKLDKEL